MNAPAPYPEYADSGDRWLGTLPSHWTTPALSQIAKIRNGSDFKSVETDSEEAIPVIGSGGVFARATQSLFDGESVLLGRKGTIDRPLYWNGPFWTVDTMFYTEIGSQLHPKFFYYFCARIDFSFYSTNTALPSMASSDLKAIRVALPPRDEQRQIAEYLDRETGQIDALITKQEQLVETLTERRQAVIAQAVTLRPGTEGSYKLKLIRAFEFLNGDRGVNYPSPDEIMDEGVPFINAGDLVAGKLAESSMKYISEEKYSKMGGAKLRSGDLLYCLRGSLGKNAMVDELAHGTLASSLVAIRNRSNARTSTRYVFWLLNSPLEKTQREVVSSGSAQPNLAAESVGSMVFVVPHVREQRIVAARLDAETSKTDDLIGKAREVVGVLKERRQALISAAVTGKINVRGL